MEVAKEHAIMCFEADFTAKSFPGIPQGLKHILKNFKAKNNESPLDSRKRLYRRLAGILWYGNKIGQDCSLCGKSPTYIYPESLKKVIRAVAQVESDDEQTHPDPQRKSVYHVTIDDLNAAIWPALPKSKK
ncbi:hypothetical protein AC249_AIPGENE24890 [Exaiptasia diaphana]|nr:hypothetical protein AC249_AIPGENE24890 [Exaiptasia diaphana]